MIAFMIKVMKTFSANIQNNSNTRLVSHAGVFACLETLATQVTFYWYSAVFYFGYFSQMPNRQ